MPHASRTRSMKAMRAVVALGLCLASAACGDDSFQVRRAPEFPRTAASRVSVFGVYKDGRLAPEAWDPLRSPIKQLFGPTTCEPGYPDLLTASGTPVLQAVDDFSRANGVTDELLDLLATHAKGDYVLLITETGRPGNHVESSPPGGGPAALSAGGRGGAAGPAPARKPVPDAGSFEMVGVVFSAHAHKSVGAIRMSFSGASLDVALQSFFARLARELPGATCQGWRGDLRLDLADVKRLATD